MKGAAQAGQYLPDTWELCATEAGQCSTPADLAAINPDWIKAMVPGTVAGALQAAGRWSLDGPAQRLDAHDWWFRARFDLADTDTVNAALEFDGLATECEVWLNGDLLHRSQNMHLSHVVPARHLKAGRNELLLSFRSLDAALKKRRPRPRWRAPMIENQQLRWFRTTVLGRTPGWSPPAAPVGPWRPVRLRLQAESVSGVKLRTQLDGTNGTVEFSAVLGDDSMLRDAVLELRRGDILVSSAKTSVAAGSIQATLTAAGIEAWWPHTHGSPTLYDLQLVGRDNDGSEKCIALGRTGFRRIERRENSPGAFAMAVNGEHVFCRGACWTPLDIITLQTDAEALDRALQQVVAAGFNMLRISGAFIYEEEQFFAACDELGIMIWQDFMFANMDYPATDEGFMASVSEEAKQQLRGWMSHPCVTMICGNSEVAQQASMWGSARELWSAPLFDETLRTLAREFCPEVPYWPSSAFGGDFPHQVDSGTCSYYGVGAYLRNTDDARQSGLRFATECLGFANVPDTDSLLEMPGGASIRVHHAAWKQRAPRDLGAGWDFDDVRDHYLRQFFGADPLQLRYSDHARYLDLSRRVPGEAMHAAFSQWRRPGSGCGGALVWFLRDLWMGAGWGIVDARGEPKAPYHALRELLQPRWICITDEGLNGLAIHVGNEPSAPLVAQLELALYRDGQHLITRAEQALELEPHSARTVMAASLLNEFHDLTHAYRFGPLSCDLVIATLTTADGSRCQAFHVPYPNLHATPHPAVQLTATARRAEASEDYELTVRSTAFARSVFVDVPGYIALKQYFSLAPGSEMALTLRPRIAGAPRPVGSISSLNSSTASRIEVAN